MSTSLTHNSTTDSPRLCLAFELGWSQRKQGFALGSDARGRHAGKCREGCEMHEFS